MSALLLVDDEEHFIETLKKVIRWETLPIADVYEARDGITALEIIKEKKPDIVITDMNMPYNDGVELMVKCEEMALRPQFIVVSGYDDYRYTHQAIKSGVMDYILKPINPDELNTILAKAVQNIGGKAGGTPGLQPNPHVNYAVEIKRYIEENYTTQISLDFLAQKFYLSKEQLIKKFKSVYGMGVYEYVMQLRMQKARYLLGNFDYQIQEVSGLVGFNDSNYFSKAFRKYFGYSPKQIKQENER